MYLTVLQLSNFRNYQNENFEFVSGKNIIIGQNAQGKTNLLEAIEYLSTGNSMRAVNDSQLINWQAARARAELNFESNGYIENLSIELENNEKEVREINYLKKNDIRVKRISKQIKINGVIQKSRKNLLGKFLTVSFSTEDLNLLRGGPKFRREWLDQIICRVCSTFYDILANYAKCLSQKNKLLKTLFEKGKLTVSDQNELDVWNKQLARIGASIIKYRLNFLSKLLPMAEQYQYQLSQKQEYLSVDYFFCINESFNSENKEQENLFDELNVSDDLNSYETDLGKVSFLSDTNKKREINSTGNDNFSSFAELISLDEISIAKRLYTLMKEKKWLELRRKQSIVGPHRDNIVFKLNTYDAVDFASQGQQRSIVLSMKLAELDLIENELGSSPVLLLDDVLAELDLLRQEFLLSALGEKRQTIMSTTHISGINPVWTEGAKIMSIKSGQLEK